MYRIAVIENETELQRYGHANVARNLKQAISTHPDAKHYSFQSFTSANIELLFQQSSNSILEFDGLFLSTNACSDKVVLDCFRRNKDKMIEFIESDRGIYIGYQKKLSLGSKDKDKNIIYQVEEVLKTQDKTPFDFLPKEYQFNLVEEFAYESDGSSVLRVKESAEGDIKICDKNRDDVVLNYPKKIIQNNIVTHCRKNDFQNHLYKSSIYPLFQGSYETLLYDDAPDDSGKRILLARAIPKKKERIIASSVVLDWENHSTLLLNIIEYITKGISRLAFVQGKDSNLNRDFNYLINSAIISKIPCTKYNESTEISANMQFIHDVYVFAPNVKEDEVNRFWKKLKEINKNKKVYHMLIHSGGESVLKQYSNTSSLDAMKVNVATWIKNYKVDDNGYWDGFWVTYDALLMMKTSGIDYSAYLETIYHGIKKRRHKEGSYDQLIGCTLGMLTLIFNFWQDKTSEIAQTVEWINNRIFPLEDKNNGQVESMPISAFEKESFLLAFKELELAKLEGGGNKICLEGAKYDILIAKVYETLVKPQLNGTGCTEMDLCRHLQFCHYFGHTEDLPAIIEAIFDKRNHEGNWTGVGRSSVVLVGLLKTLGKEKIIEYRIEKKIEESINYVLEHYSRKNSNWRGLILDTSRALHALSLYDEMFPLSSKDFFETIQKDAELIGYNNIIETSLVTSSELQKELYTLSRKKAQLVDAINEKEATINRIDDERTVDRQKYEDRWRIVTAFSLFFGLITLGLVLFICFELSAAHKLFKSLGSIIAITVSLFISFAVEEYLHKKLFPNTYAIKHKVHKKGGGK